MKIRRILQPLLALAVVTTVVVAGPLPGGAITGTVSDGTLTVASTTPVSMSLDPGLGPCPGSSVIWLDLVSTTLTFSGHPFTRGGTTYFLTFDGPTQVLLSAGTMAVGPISGPVVNILPETSPGSCAPDWGAPLCASAGFSPANALTISGAWTGGSATLSGSRTMFASGCGAPFNGINTLNGKTLTITDMVVDF